MYYLLFEIATPRYNWILLESDIKHHNPPYLKYWYGFSYSGKEKECLKIINTNRRSHTNMMGINQILLEQFWKIKMLFWNPTRSAIKQGCWLILTRSREVYNGNTNCQLNSNTTWVKSIKQMLWYILIN